MEQEALDQFVLPSMTDIEQLRKRDSPRALGRLRHMLGHEPKAAMPQVLTGGTA